MPVSSGHTDDRQRTLDATSITDVVGEVCDLKPAGREFKCLCPFHDDHNPSMYVVPGKQIYHCFVCGAGGNAIDFVMNYHNLGYRDALQMLADKAGIELTPWKPKDNESKSAQGASRESLAYAHAFAQTFFQAILQHPEHGKAARAAAESRGLTAEMIERFGIGAAPDRFDGLLQTIHAKNQPESIFADAGLLRTKDNGHRYDTFRNRLIFPIMDQLGRPIAFGGRILDPEDSPKYLNSPEHGLFDKSSTLFGIHQAFKSIRSTRHAIVTEGYTDVIACHQHGFENVVATLGTAFTARHLSQLKRTVDRITLLFDGDEAGLRAADRAADRCVLEPLDVRIAVLPNKMDPDDILSKEGTGAFSSVIECAISAMEFRLSRLRIALEARGLKAGSPQWVVNIEEDLSRLASQGAGSLSPMQQQAIARQYAKLAQLDMQTVLQTLASAKQRPARTDFKGDAPGEAANEKLTPKTHADHLLACVLAEPKLIISDVTSAQSTTDGIIQQDFLSRVEAALRKSAYSSSSAQDAAILAADAITTTRDCSILEPARLAASTQSERTASLLYAYAMSARVSADGNIDRLSRLFHDALIACERDAETERLHTLTGPDSEPERGDAGRSQRVEDTLEAVRSRHQATGGNPLAVPTPRFPG